MSVSSEVFLVCPKYGHLHRTWPGEFCDDKVFCDQCGRTHIKQFMRALTAEEVRKLGASIGEYLEVSYRGSTAGSSILGILPRWPSEAANIFIKAQFIDGKIK